MSDNHKIVNKGWGFEKWIVNNKEYCGKLLFLESGKKCSWHYHILKDETFYIQSGKIIVKYSYHNDYDTSQSIELLPGHSFHVPRGLRHQMMAIEDTNLFEFSTEHLDSDSYRLIKGD